MSLEAHTLRLMAARRKFAAPADRSSRTPIDAGRTEIQLHQSDSAQVKVAMVGTRVRCLT
jgi:hypothetical protein